MNDREESTPTPDRVTVRMLNVGFGDCFLLSFTYAQSLEDGRDERHLLIDYGSTSRAEGISGADIAQEINTRTNGELDAVVVTHRHRDHLSAFGTTELASLLAQTAVPKLVVRPWTEDPDADQSFTGARDQPGDRSLAYVRSLRDAHEFADTVAENVRGTSGRSLSGELRQMAVTQVANADAVAQLDGWAAGKGEYLHYGMSSRIEDLVPGLSVRVLGPPTIEQHPGVAGQRESDQEEFWMLYKRLAASVPQDAFRRLATTASRRSGANETPAAGEEADPGPTQWIINKLDRQEMSSMLRIVRIMDEQLNNTSLILLFSIEGPGGTKRMLFGGDAQIENWEFALKHADVETNRALLREVDLYKVGHHGSRNATPRTLFNLWTEAETLSRPMAALLSTKAGVHGHQPQTAVPRETLVSALRERTGEAFFSSEELEGPWIDVSTDTSSEIGFAESAQG